MENLLINNHQPVYIGIIIFTILVFNGFFFISLQEFFEDVIKFMTSGPSHVLALTKGKTGENIISEFRDLIGPTDVDEAKTQAPER